MNGYLLKKIREKLKNGNYHIYLIVYILLYNFYSCKYDKTDRTLLANNYVKQNFRKYAHLYKIINDSILYYTNCMLKSFTTEYYYEWQVDSMICVNSRNDKLVATRNISIGKCKDCFSDNVLKLVGKKVEGKWYFFDSSTLVLPRDRYGKGPNNPLTFYEISQKGRKNFLAGCLVKNKNSNEWEVNDEWIDEHFYNPGYHTFGPRRNPGMIMEDEHYQMPRDKAKFDSVHWHEIIDKWRHKIDTNEYKGLKRNIIQKQNI